MRVEGVVGLAVFFLVVAAVVRLRVTRLAERTVSWQDRQAVLHARDLLVVNFVVVAVLLPLLIWSPHLAVLLVLAVVVPVRCAREINVRVARWRDGESRR